MQYIDCELKHGQETLTLDTVVSTLLGSNTGILEMNEIVVAGSRFLWLNFSYLCNHCSPTIFKTDFVYYLKIMPGENKTVHPAI